MSAVDSMLNVVRRCGGLAWFRRTPGVARVEEGEDAEADGSLLKRRLVTGVLDARGWMTGLNLDEVGDVERHLVDLGVVESLQLAERGDVFRRDEVDRDALSAETAATSDTVDVARRGPKCQRMRSG